MTPTAVIFDCDGVLVDSEYIAIDTERKFLAGIGLNYDYLTYIQRFVGLDDADFQRLLAEDYRALARGTFPDDFMARLKAAIWRRFEAQLAAIAGIELLLDRIDCPIAVASSSTTRSLHRMLHLTGLYDRFDPHIHSSEQVRRGKPEPDLFLLAADRLGRTPADCLVIEDSIHGITAARAAGMTAWGFTGGRHADAGLGDRLLAAGANRVFPDHAKMLTAISPA